MKGIKFANVRAVWKWYKPIYMLVFVTIFFIKRALLKRLYLQMKVLQSTTIFKQKIVMKCLAIKFLHEIVYNSKFKKYNCNSVYGYNSRIWVDIPSYHDLILYFHVYSEHFLKMFIFWTFWAYIMYRYGDIRVFLRTGMAIQSKLHVNPYLFINFTQMNHISLLLDDSPTSRNEAFCKTLRTRPIHVIIQNLDLTLTLKWLTLNWPLPPCRFSTMYLLKGELNPAFLWLLKLS